jgi:hypothetical protein
VNAAAFLLMRDAVELSGPVVTGVQPLKTGARIPHARSQKMQTRRGLHSVHSAPYPWNFMADNAIAVLFAYECIRRERLYSNTFLRVLAYE